MNDIRHYSQIPDHELAALIEQAGHRKALAAERGWNYKSFHRYSVRHLGKAGQLAHRVAGGQKQERPTEVAAGVFVDGDTATIIEPATGKPELGDLGKLIRERGLDPDEWVVVTAGLNEWDAMAAVQRGDEPKTVRLRQWKVTLRRAPHLILAAPAVHVPAVKRAPGPAPSMRPDTIVVEGDHQAPYHDPKLHEASLRMLRELSRRHRLAEHVFHGDTGDYPTISKHADHPAALAPVNTVTQTAYELLRDKREAAPQARARKLKGNHDWRVESELLLRAERMYGIKPADTEAGPELPALHISRLLHLDKLGIELIEDRRGWQHAEAEIVPGPTGLVVRHGWLTGANTASKTLAKRGRSIIVGHTHSREHTFKWDSAAETERQAVVCGTMSHVRDERFPHYAVCDNWLQGFVVVTRWPDGHFEIEHARWNGTALHWRDKRFTA